MSEIGDVAGAVQSPLFLQFESVEVARFPLDATVALVECILGANPAAGAGRRLHDGTSGRLALPAITQVAPYRAADGQAEVDAVAETVSGERWAVELRWQRKAVGEKELIALAANGLLPGLP